MINARLLGEQIYLRPFERDDITDEYSSWVNDMSINKYIIASGFPTNKEMLHKYFDNSQPTSAVLFAICDKATDTHIGNARLSLINWVHRHATYGRLLGHPDFRGRGYGSDALIQLLRFGFHHLGLNRIWSSAVVANEVSLSSNDKVGMAREGVLRQYVYAGGRFHDTIMLAMLREDFDRLHGTPEEWAAKEAAYAKG